MTEAATTNVNAISADGSIEIARTKYVAPLELGGEPILAAVTSNGTRLLSERGITKAFGGKRGGAHWRRAKSEAGNLNLPPFLSAMNLREFVLQDEVLVKGLANRITFAGAGGRAAGIEAILLPRMCEVLLRARDAGKVAPQQEHIVVKADILMRGLAHVGIIALVDEATGYQADRAKDTLEVLLREYVSAELSRWARTFQDDFYRELFRLRDLTYDEFSNKRPQYIGHITNDIVYSRIAPMLLQRLKEVAPRRDDGRLKTRLYYNLQNPGYVRLVEHLATVIALMKISSTWKQFYGRLNQVAPRFDESMTMALLED